jgi:transcriptional regulator with XRE-family HTH domain
MASETIGERLRRLRLERGLSQRVLAEPGVSYAYISRIESGSRQPSVKAIRKLARKLDVSPVYLETGSELAAHEDRELRITDAELEVRLADDPGAAVAKLEELLAEARAAGDNASLARALAALGLAAARSGSHETTVAYLEEAIALPQTSALSRPDIYSTLGRAHAFLGNQPRAVEVWQGALDELVEKAPENLSGRVRFATYLSYALSDLGQFDRAREVLAEALEAAGREPDPFAEIRVSWGLARLLALEGESGQALSHARRAIALLEATEDRIDLGRAHVLCAFILNDDKRPEEAGRHLAIGERLLGETPERADVALLRTEQARVAAQTGDAQRAIERANEALVLLGDDDPAERGAALAALADGLVLAGRAGEAETPYAEAVRLLVENGRLRPAAGVQLRWGRSLRAAGREAEAIEILEPAAELAAQALGASETAPRARPSATGSGTRARGD